MKDDMGLDRSWTTEQLGIFIDQVKDDRFAALWLLIATTGVRLDALAGLHRDEIDLHERRLYPRARPVAVGDPTQAPTFSREGYDVGPDAYDVLKDHVIAWDKEREEFAPHARNLFLWSDGTTVHPNAIASMFHQHCDNAGLPVVPMREVRQAYVIAALETGIPTQVIRERLGDHLDSPNLGIGKEPTPGGLQRTARKRTMETPPPESRRAQPKTRHLRSV